jgi:hypothetical protein
VIPFIFAVHPSPRGHGGGCLENLRERLDEPDPDILRLKEETRRFLPFFVPPRGGLHNTCQEVAALGRVLAE